MMRVLKVVRVIAIILFVYVLAVAVDWPLLISWVTNVVQGVLGSLWSAWQALVSMGLAPDAIHPDRLVLR